MSSDVRYEDFTFEDGGFRWPFIEDENANVHGYGHQDKAKFAEAVAAYERHCGYDGSESWGADAITHRWAVMDPDGERFTVASKSGTPYGPKTPDSFPITCLWGQR